MRRFRLFLLSACLFVSILQNGLAQEEAQQFLDLDLAVGDREGSAALNYTYDLAMGRKKKVVVGLGGRFTSYTGQNRYYVTAPAKLTSGSTGPLVIFRKNIEANMDSLLVSRPQFNSLNVQVTIGYDISEKLMLRFNIDAVGVSFGKTVRGNYINGSEGSFESASPTAFNILLISDNDKGSLNSDLFARYLLNDKLGAKLGLQFLFTEYTTKSKVQRLPELNDRFRQKSLMLSVGISLKL